MKKTIVVTCGITCIGKSSFINYLNCKHNNCNIISLDDIKEKISENVDSFEHNFDNSYDFLLYELEKNLKENKEENFLIDSPFLRNFLIFEKLIYLSEKYDYKVKFYLSEEIKDLENIYESILRRNENLNINYEYTIKDLEIFNEYYYKQIKEINNFFNINILEDKNHNNENVELSVINFITAQK